MVLQLILSIITAHRLVSPVDQEVGFTSWQLSGKRFLSFIIFFGNTNLTVNCILQAICTEAGLMALRERRMKVTNEDFKKSKENVLYKKQEGTPEGLYL